MNTSNAKSAGILLAVALLAISTYGLWYAWNQGLVGHNPRAPVAEAMEPAVLIQAKRTARNRLNRTQCLPINLRLPKPEINGRPGIALRTTPNSFDITLLLKTDYPYQPQRDEQITQLNYLAKQGLLAASDVTIDTDEGPRSARNYRMTWAGYAASPQKNASSLCLSTGKREYAGIERIEPREERMLDHEVFAVTYRNRVLDRPAWTATAEAKQLFPKLAELTEDKLDTVLVLRTQEGWRAPWELQQELATAANTMKARSSTSGASDRENPPLPTEAETDQLLEAWMNDNRLRRNDQIACLPLRLERSSDDRTLAASATTTTKEFVVTYMDRDGRKGYEYTRMARNLHILFALEQAGLASREILVTEQPKSVSTTDTTPVDIPASPLENTQNPAGIRYRIPAAFMDMLKLQQYGGGCIPAGRMKLQFMGVDQESGRVMVYEKATLSEAPPWTAQIATHLPAMQALREDGVPVNIGMMYLKRGSDADKAWRVVQFSPLYPEIAYSDIPVELRPFLPKTTVDAPNPAIRAPISGTPKVIPPKVVTLDPQVSIAGFPRNSNQVVTVVTPDQPPFPAQGAAVHVISVYQGATYGAPHRANQHAMYPVRITVSKPNTLLILLSYEPVDWQIHAANNAQPRQVLVFGYYDSRVTFSGSKKVPTTIARTSELPLKWKISVPKTPTKPTEEVRIDITQLSEKLTGAKPDGFQTSYEAPSAGFQIDNQTSRFIPPGPRKPSNDAPLAILQSLNRGNAGNRLIRQNYGAMNDGWSNHAYSAGKLYFEGTIDIHGAATRHAFSNIGLCLSRDGKSAGLPGAVLAMGYGRTYQVKDGDVFGIAADLDQHQMYAHINGAWLTGQPDSGNGIPLAAGKLYRACVFASGSSRKGAPPSYTSWEVNFGAQPFVMKPPAGYGAF